MSGQTARRVGIAACCLLFCVAVVVLRVVIESHLELSRATQAADHGDLDGEIVHLGRAARWYAPGGGAAARALVLLREVATRAEGTGDDKTALAAWQEIRGAVLSTRSTYVPHPQALAEADQHIAVLMAKAESPTIAPNETFEQRRVFHLGLLENDDMPRVSWTLLALLGLCGWIGGALYFIFRAIGEDDRLLPRPALYAGLTVVACFALFLLGLARA